MAATATVAALFQAAAGWVKAAAEKLRAAGVEVLAPIEREPGRVDLAQLNSRNGLAASYLNAVLPLKRLFFPETEVILNYDKREGKDVALDVPSAPAAERVVLGCRPCDASALAALDQVFEWDYDDVRYRQHRERTAIVAFACTEPDGDCFCTSVGGSPQGEAGSDVLAFPTKDGGALLKAITEKGARLMERLDGVVQPAPDNAKLPESPW